MEQIKNYLIEQELTEGLKYFKLSKQMERLIKKLKDRFIELPGKEKPDAELLMDIIQDELLPVVKKAETDYKKGKIGKQEALEILARMRPKLKEAKRILIGHNILPDYKNWAYVVGSLMWIPSAVAGVSIFDIGKVAANVLTGNKS